MVGGLLGLAAAGCASPLKTVPSADLDWQQPPADRTIGPDAPWPFWAARMRIHPLSQFVKHRDTGELLIEVRVEFFDPDDYTCRVVGQIGIDLVDASNVNAEPVSKWQDDLWDPQINRDRYDEITRTYLFRLKMDGQQVPQAAQIRVYFLSGDGKRLQDTYSLGSTE